LGFFFFSVFSPCKGFFLRVSATSSRGINADATSSFRRDLLLISFFSDVVPPFFFSESPPPNFNSNQPPFGRSRTYHLRRLEFSPPLSRMEIHPVPLYTTLPQVGSALKRGYLGSPPPTVFPRSFPRRPPSFSFQDNCSLPCSFLHRPTAWLPPTTRDRCHYTLSKTTTALVRRSLPPARRRHLLPCLQCPWMFSFLLSSPEQETLPVIAVWCYCLSASPLNLSDLAFSFPRLVFPFLPLGPLKRVSRIFSCFQSFVFFDPSCLQPSKPNGL